MLRVLPVLLFALLLALPAAADEPRFFIERIEVSGIRWSSENVLLAESRLDAGRTYTESELRDAMARIRRLPFVLHADFRLEKGTQREQYVLIVDVDETSPLFGSLLMTRVVIEPARRPPPPNPPPDIPPFIPPRRITTWRNQATFGGRLFVGANGVFHAALEKRGELLEGQARSTAGYTHYDLFGSGASLAVAVQHEDRQYGPMDTLMRTRDELSYAAVAAVPLFANQSLRASWDRSTFRVSRPVPGGFEPFRLQRDTMRLSWIYDTTDDPLLPSSGTFVSAGGQLSEDVRLGTVIQTRDVSAQAIRYWDVTPRQSLVAGAEYETFFGWQQNERRVRVGYSGKLFDRDLSLRWGDLRFDAAAERIYFGNRGQELESRTTVSGGMSYRNRWGITRFEVEYLGWRNIRR